LTLNKKIFISVLSLLVCGAFFSQNRRKADSLLKILHSSNDSLYIHNACELADELVELRDLTGAFKYMDTALTKAKDLKNERLMGYVYINIGNTYNYMSDLNRALDAFENSRIHYEKVKYLPGIASVVLDIGNAYYYAGEIKKAYNTYKEALAIQLKCPKDNISMANVLNNVGSACGMLEKYDEAEKYLLQVEELNKQDNDLLSLAKTYNNLGSVYQGKKNSKKAMDYFKKAFELKLKYGSNVDKADAYKTQATIFMNQKKQNEAIENLHKALIYTDTNVYNSDLKAIYNNLATLYELKKNFEMANYYNWKLKNIHKETFANELQRTVEQKQMMATFRQNHLRDSLVQSAKIEKQNAQISKNELIRTSLLIIVLIIGVFSFLLYKRFKLTQSQNELITKQKQLVEEKQNEILSSIHYAQRIQRSLLPTDKFIERIFNKKKPS